MDDYSINSTTDFSSSNSNYMNDYHVNPSTVLPIICGFVFHVSWNTFGSSYSNYMTDYDINPATGLPMISGSGVDVSGNGFGSSNNSFYNNDSFNDYQNKTTNVKALDKRIGYLFLVIAIIHISFLAYCIITHYGIIYV